MFVFIVLVCFHSASQQRGRAKSAVNSCAEPGKELCKQSKLVLRPGSVATLVLGPRSFGPDADVDLLCMRRFRALLAVCLTPNAIRRPRNSSSPHFDFAALSINFVDGSSYYLANALK